MRKLAFALAATAVCALSVPATPARASMETVEAQMTATSAASLARHDMYEAFGVEELKTGQYLARDVPASAGEATCRDRPLRPACLSVSRHDSDGRRD